MSRIGRKVLAAPQGRHARRQKPGSVSVKGPKGELDQAVPTGVEHQDRGGQDHRCSRADDERQNRAKHGLMRALLANMVKGVTDGLRRASSRSTASVTAPRSKGDTMTMALGFSHPVVFKLPEGVTAKVDKNMRDRSPASTRSCSAQTAAKIRELRPPEPYKGKGVKYVEEVIKKKVGKAGATAASGMTTDDTHMLTDVSIKKARPQEAASLASASASRAPPSVRASPCSAARSTSTRRSIDDVDRQRRSRRRPTLAQGASRREVEGDKKAARQAGRRGDRQEVPREGHRQGRVRPQRLHLPRSRHGARRRRARSRARSSRAKERH